MTGGPDHRVEAKPDAGPDTDPDGEAMDRLRRSGISIDREGDFVHQGERVGHLGLRQALFRWLDRLPAPDGRHVLRLDARRFAYVDVEDTPLVARGARRGPDGFLLALSDGNEELLDPRTLTVDSHGILRCRVRGGVLEARLATSAAAVLGEAIEPTPSTSSGAEPALVLRTDGGAFAIPERR